MDKWTHDNTAPLACCPYPDLERRIGVRVSVPFPHLGRGGVPHVRVYRESIEPNTATFGDCVPALEATAAYRRDTAAIIAELDTIIAELQAHRDRLRALLEDTTE